MQNIAANGLSDRVSVVHRDIGLLQRGREVRALGANVAIADIFDSGKNPTLRVYSWQVIMTSTDLFDFSSLLCSKRECCRSLNVYYASNSDGNSRLHLVLYRVCASVCTLFIYDRPHPYTQAMQKGAGKQTCAGIG